MESSSQRYDVCIGRWRVFHDGHKALIRKVWEQNKRPIMVMVMDTNEEPNPEVRAAAIRAWLLTESIGGIVMVIPPVASVNYGRDVGYEVNQVHLPAEIEDISATKILRGDNGFA